MTSSLAAIAASLALASPALAADDGAAEIVVTAARGTALKDMDVSATVVGAAEVAAMPATSTDQIVNKIPGVFTLNSPAAVLHPTGDTFSIRGFGTTTNVNTLVMLDGIPMNDPYFRVVDWNQIGKGQIQSIEVIRGGGATSLWGNMAMGGIVNIVSKPPQPGQFDFDASLGSYHTLSGSANAGLGLGKDTVAGISLSDTTTDGYNKTPAAYQNPFMAATSSHNVNVAGTVRTAPSADLSLFVSALWHSLEEQDLVWTQTRNRWTTWRLSFGGEKRAGRGRLALTGWVGGGTMDTTNVGQTPAYSIFTPALGVPYVSQTETATYRNLGGSLVWTASLGALHDIKVGVDGRSLIVTDPVNFFIATGPSGNILAHAQHRFEGVFAQATVTPVALPLEITLGLREDLWQTAGGSLSGLYRGTGFGNTIPDQTYARFDPRLGAKLTVRQGLVLRGAVYRNFAAPGMNQMYRGTFSGTNAIAVNPDLKPQTNTGGEAGIDLTGSGMGAGLTLSATAFTNTLQNFIDYATVQTGCAAANAYCGTGISGLNGGTLSQYVNAGDARLRGFEVLGGWRLGRVALRGGFTYTDAHLTRSLYTVPSGGVTPDPTFQQLGQVPEWVLTAGASWTPTDRVRIDAAVKAFPSYWNNTSHTQRNDGAAIVDLGASWRIANGAEIYTSLQNVGNRHFFDQGLGTTTTNGSTIKGSTVPALGLPFWATVGIRAHI